MLRRKCEICGMKSKRVDGKKRFFMARFPLDESRCKEWVKVTGFEDLAYIEIEKLHELKLYVESISKGQIMQREEKQLEATIQAILSRVNDLKSAIQALINKLETEYETINWPTFLDNYAILSGHLTGLSKILQAELAAPLRSQIVLPLLLRAERDEELVRLTEGRVPACTHDLVPDLLRTKPEPQAEARLQQFNHKASTQSYDAAQKQVAQFSKVVGHVWEIISKGREDWEGDSMRSAGMQPTHSMADTHALVTAVGTGKGLRPGMPPIGPAGVAPGMGPARGPAPMGPAAAAMPKAPSAIKTNIKAANQIHPYQR